MGYGMMNNGMYGGGLFAMVFHILFWVLLLAGAYFLIRWVLSNFNNNCKTSSNLQTNPIEIAKLRYAKGEISREEFDQIKRDLA